MSIVMSARYTTVSVIRLMEPAWSGAPADDLTGKWLVECDVDGDEGRGVIIATDDILRAMHFASNMDALQYWQRQSNVQPYRPDGKQNRPLTAYHAMIQVVEITHAS